MKVCFKCGIKKEMKEFYKHKAMSDGHLNKCKQCTKRDVRIHRANTESVREYDRTRAKFPHRKEHAKRIQAKWISENRDGARAHVKVRRAVKSGLIKKMPCEICGAERVHAHHKDYSKPLDVIWLCPRHHHKMHSMTRST